MDNSTPFDGAVWPHASQNGSHAGLHANLNRAVSFLSAAKHTPWEETQGVMQILKAGLLYFALVFGVGFVLGPVRIRWVVPQVGPRMAELMETPIMLMVTIFAARWVVRRLAVPSKPSNRL